MGITSETHVMKGGKYEGRCLCVHGQEAGGGDSVIAMSLLIDLEGNLLISGGVDLYTMIFLQEEMDEGILGGTLEPILGTSEAMGEGIMPLGGGGLHQWGDMIEEVHLEGGMTDGNAYRNQFLIEIGS